MTVALAALAGDSIVAVSDRRLSYGEAIPALDDAALKNRGVVHRVGVLFAATDATTFLPVLGRMRKLLSNDSPTESKVTIDEIKQAAIAAYEAEFEERVFRLNVSKFACFRTSEMRLGFANKHIVRAGSTAPVSPPRRA